MTPGVAEIGELGESKTDRLGGTEGPKTGELGGIEGHKTGDWGEKEEPKTGELGGAERPERIKTPEAPEASSTSGSLERAMLPVSLVLLPE